MSVVDWMFAVSYDLLNSGVEGRLRAYRQRTAGRATGDVLEIGGGTGANLPYYPDDARLTVVEPNPHMAGRLLKRAASSGRRVTVLPDPGERLTFPDGSFDSVVTTLVLCMVHDLDRVVGEARRVLRPGGVFYFYEHVVSDRPWPRALQNGLNPAWRLLTTGCNLNRDIAGAIRDGGFRRLEMEPFELGFGGPLSLPNIVGSATA